MCDSQTRLEGKVAIVTGGSSGIGFEAAKKLADRGAKVIIASKNETKLKNARREIRKATGNKDIVYRTLDLGSLKSVRNFARDTLISEKRIDVLINNAGAIGLPDKLTEDDLNLTMQVNYFGTFLLTFLLLPMLKYSAPSRIINGVAGAMYIGAIDFDHWNEVGRYSIVESLANSKLATALFTAELDRRLQGTGVTANTFDPFVVSGTDILKNMPPTVKTIGEVFINTIGQSKELVGNQIAYIASAPDLKNVSGENFQFCQKFVKHWLVYDTNVTNKLWSESKKLVKLNVQEDWEANGLYYKLYSKNIKSWLINKLSFK